MISRTSKYALNVLRHLARDPGSRIPADVLARETGVPANYLSKILNQLRKHRVVEGEKGWGGGFRLRREALDLAIGDIVVIFDDARRAGRDLCVFGLAACDSDHPCVLHPYWERMRAAFDELVTTNKVRDLLGMPPDWSRRELNVHARHAGPQTVEKRRTPCDRPRS